MTNKDLRYFRELRTVCLIHLVSRQCCTYLLFGLYEKGFKAGRRSFRDLIEQKQVSQKSLFLMDL